MSESKTIGDFEKEQGMIVLGEDPTTIITRADFDALPQYKKIGVNHEDRVAFLEANGYEVTRENMVDVNLSHRQPKQKGK